MSTEKFDLQQLATPHAQLPTTILELLSLRVPWEYGQHSTHTTQRHCCSLCASSRPNRKKRNASSISLNDLEFQNK